MASRVECPEHGDVGTYATDRDAMLVALAHAACCSTDVIEIREVASVRD